MTPFDADGYAGHEVLNQPPPLFDYDSYSTDWTLRAVVSAFGAGWGGVKGGENVYRRGGPKVYRLARSLRPLRRPAASAGQAVAVAKVRTSMLTSRPLARRALATTVSLCTSRPAQRE